MGLLTSPCSKLLPLLPEVWDPLGLWGGMDGLA